MTSARNDSQARTLGLFEKRFDGDDALMELARRRFREANMGTEIHGGTSDHLEGILGFRPDQNSAVVIHLPRDFNLVDGSCGERILELARRFAGRIIGFVLHDHASMPARAREYLAAAWKLENQLERIERCPSVFVEYAAGLDLEDFARFVSAIRDLDHLSACIDISHVGIRYARAAYARSHAGEDICALKSQGPELPRLLPDVQAAVARGADSALQAIEAVAAFQKPVHFHLHDGHPLSTFSPFGVSDHLSFFAEIPLSFEYEGGRALKPMFGPEGLRRVIQKALELMGGQRLSLTLEIHPAGERLALGDAAPLFGHWQDKSNAEKMNHWLAVLRDNHALLKRTLESILPEPAKPGADKAQHGPEIPPGEPASDTGGCDI